MITAAIFALHVIFLLVVFTKKWQDENLTSAFLNGGLVALLFSVGWSMATIPTKYLFDEKGFGVYYDRDAITLTILSIAEFIFYRIYYDELFKEQVSVYESGVKEDVNKDPESES